MSTKYPARRILSSTLTAACVALGGAAATVHSVSAETFSTFVSGRILPLFDAIISFAMVLAVIFFIFAVVRFMATAGDERSRGAGKAMLVWGTLALVVMVSVWGIVGIIKTTFFKAP